MQFALREAKVVESRRRWLKWLGTAGVLATEISTVSLVFAQRPTPQPIPSPNAPDPHFPPGMNGPDLKPDRGERRFSPDAQKEVTQDVDQLYELAAQLKAQVEKNTSPLVLSVSFFKNAQQAEKLAKKIKELSKGSRA